MSEQERNKAGLHKEISSIFKRVRIPQNDGGQEPSGTPALERTDHSEPKPPATEPQKPEAPKPDQFTQSLSKATSAQQPKADIDDTEKNISGSKGIPLWQADGAEQPCDTPVPERAGYTEPKPQKPEAPKPDQVTQSLPKAAPEHTDHTEPKPAATDPQKPKAPKAYQATQSLPTSISAQQPKADIDGTGKEVSQKSAIVTISNKSFLQRIKNKLLTPKAGVSDTKQKTMAIMMPVLFIILLVFVFKGGVFGTKVPETEASGQDTASSVATADSNNEIDWEIPAPYPTTLRDPMRLDPVEDAQTGTEIEIRTFVRPIVKGILYSEDEASAVVGNQIVHEGEKIQGVTVIRIGKDTVEFEMNGKRWTQKVRQ